jgi:hypothetical protein
MRKSIITKQKIFDAAKVIAHLDKEPTMARVREHLAFTGSQTTLHKYLKEWRLSCFKAYDPNCVKGIEQKDIAKLQAENQALATTISKMEDHNKIVAAEFAKTERKNVDLIQIVTRLEQQLALLEKEFNSLKKDKEHLDNTYRDLKEEREVLLGKMEKDKDQLIASLREELCQTHQANLQKIQDVSYQGHDLLMQEKVKTINLEEKIKSLTEEMAKLQQELNYANRAVEPLKTQIKGMEKLIFETLTSEQLRAYEKKQQSLDFY